MIATFILQRLVDHSNVSGTGVVAYGAEFPDGAVALRWPGEHPSTAAWEDVRDMEAVHGHDGDTLVEYTSESRLLAAYQRVMPWLLSARYHDRPTVCAPHPDHPDRLRLVFLDERVWRFWIALMDGSSHAAVHEEVNGEMQHRFTTPDGLIWLVYHSPIEMPKTYHDPFDDAEEAT